MSVIRSKGSLSRKLERAFNKVGERLLNPLRRKPILFFGMLCIIVWELSEAIASFSEIVRDGEWDWLEWAAVWGAILLGLDHLLEFGSNLPHQFRRGWYSVVRGSKYCWRAFYRWQIKSLHQKAACFPMSHYM